MTGKLLILAAAAGMLVASSTIGFAENTSAPVSGAKIQEKGPANAKTATVNPPGQLVQEDEARPGGAAFAASQGTTGNVDRTQSYDRGPSVPSDKR